MERESADVPGHRKSSSLTGSGRKIRDNAADWHNLMLRWQKLNDEGFRAATSVANLRSARQQQPLDQEGLQTGGAVAALYCPELQVECSRLKDVVDKMSVVVGKMERLMASQRGVQELEDFRRGSQGKTAPLFQSWTTPHFEETGRVLLDAYRAELQLKETVLRELAHAPTSDLCVLYLSCWLQQPLLPPQARLRLEALLLETGHRPT